MIADHQKGAVDVSNSWPALRNASTRDPLINSRLVSHDGYEQFIEPIRRVAQLVIFGADQCKQRLGDPPWCPYSEIEGGRLAAFLAVAMSFDRISINKLSDLYADATTV